MVVNTSHNPHTTNFSVLFEQKKTVINSKCVARKTKLGHTMAYKRQCSKHSICKYSLVSRSIYNSMLPKNYGTIVILNSLSQIYKPKISRINHLPIFQIKTLQVQYPTYTLLCVTVLEKPGSRFTETTWNSPKFSIEKS